MRRMRESEREVMEKRGSRVNLKESEEEMRRKDRTVKGDERGTREMKGNEREVRGVEGEIGEVRGLEGE